MSFIELIIILLITLGIVDKKKLQGLYATFKNIQNGPKREKCVSKGVTIGGDNADVYMPQFINFFKENLL